MTTYAKMRRAAGLALALAVTTACGKNSTGPGGRSVPCTITLTGAQSGAPACSDVAAVWTSNNNAGSFGLRGTGAADTLSIAVGFEGAPTVHSYAAGTDAYPTAILTNGSTVWVTDMADGSLTLAISSVKLISSGAGVTSYEVHGSLTATMAAEVSNGSIGPVTVTATF